MFHLHQQEYEECSACLGECCCESPDYGETFDLNCCMDCVKFLEAVRVAEIEAGCALSEALPLLGEMVVQIGEGGHEEAKKYVKKAIKLFPELKASGYLGWLWRQMF